MRKLAWCALLGIMGSAACQPLVQSKATSEDMSQLFDPPASNTVIANFDPLAGILPFPTNLIFSGTTDGTLNAPVVDPNDYADPAVAMNTLDGYSGIATAYTSFSGSIDASTVIAGDTVRVFEVALEGFFLTASSVIRELQAPDALLGIAGDYTVQVIPQAQIGADGNPTGLTYDTVAVVPTTPLPADSSYVVVLTTNILDLQGRQVKRDLIYNIAQMKETLLNEAGQSQLGLPASNFDDSSAQALEPLRELVSSFENVIAQYGIPSSSVAVSWAYTIASDSLMLDVISSEMTATTIEAGPVIVDPATLAIADTSLAGFAGTADIYVGTLEVPFYLNPDDPAAGFWMGLQNQFPTKFYYAAGGRGPMQRSTEVVPLMITVPNANSGCTKPAEGWATTLFVHTNTQDRSNVLALADAFSTPSAPGANDCVVGIGMDLPVSGIPSTIISSTPGTCGEEVANAAALFGPNTIGLLPWFPKTGTLVKERFNTNPDVTIDPKATTTFFNPASLLTVRDNIRQAVVDHVAAARTLPDLRDTWSGAVLASGVSAATFAIVPNGEVDEVTGLPVAGPIRDALDAVDAIITLDANGAPAGGAGAVTLGTLQAAAAVPATNLVTTSIVIDADGDTVPDTLVPTSGAIYDAIRAAGVLSIASDVTTQVATADPTSSAAAVAAALGATLDGLAPLGVTDGYVNPDAGAGVDPFALPDVNDSDFRAELDGLLSTASADAGTFGDVATAIGGLLSTKVTAVVEQAQAADAGLAATVATFDGWNTAVDNLAALVPGMAELPDAVISALFNTYALASSESAIPADMLAQVLELHDTVVGIKAAIDGIVADPAAAPALLAGASAATLAAAAGQATVSSDLIAAIGAPAADGGSGLLANFELALVGAGDVAGTLGDLLGASGGVAGAVSECAAQIVSFDADGNADFADPATAVGRTFSVIAQAVGTPDGSVRGVASLLGAAAGEVSAETLLLTAVASAWKSNAPFVDMSKLAITGHAMGAVVALLTASVTPEFASVIASSPTGGMAYAFEKSDTFGPALVAGLADAAGIAPGEAAWEQYFNVFQNVMGQADPLNYVDSIPDSTGVLVFEFEDDAFFPNSDASRPLAGSGPLIDALGLERVNQSVADTGAPVRAAMTINTSDSTADFGTFLSPLLGCPDGTCAYDGAVDLECIGKNLDVRTELHNQTRSMIVNGGRSVNVVPLAPSGLVVIE